MVRLVGTIDLEDIDSPCPRCWPPTDENTKKVRMIFEILEVTWLEVSLNLSQRDRDQTLKNF